jgi:hypothetical protein
LDEYIAGVSSAATPIVRALDRAIRAAGADFDVAIKYRILLYALHSDWRTWVVAIDARQKVVSLRFLFGVLLDDPRGVLRKGSSVLMTWDFGLSSPVDEAAVTDYVREAVARYPHYKANTEAILAASRTAAPGRVARH